MPGTNLRLGTLTGSAGRPLAALVEYDGTDFQGFQRLKGKPSVQGALEEVLTRLAGHPVRIRGAGRTDSGVHAVGQVIAFARFWQRDLAELGRALNALLPPSLAVRELAEAPEGFDPRRSARGREYVYIIWNEPLRSPLQARWSWHVPQPLDLGAMRRAASSLEGERDFAALGPSPTGGSTVRRVDGVEVRRLGRRVLVEMRANAFLTGMVRRTVEGLVKIGRGDWRAERLEEIVSSRDPARIQGLAPPQGLVLRRVWYEREIFSGEPNLEHLGHANLYA